MAKSTPSPGDAASSPGRRALGSKRQSSLPIYHQLYVVLRQQILDETYGAEVPLPSEFALAENYEVSRVTVRRTLDMLEKDGLIERRRGVGTFAVQRDPEEDAEISGVLENLITIGLKTEAQTLLFEAQVPPRRVQRVFRLDTETHAVCIERLRTHASKPFSLTKVWLPAQHAKLLDQDSLGDKPVAVLLEAKGLSPISADQSISAILADDHSSKYLNVSIGAPLIRLQRTVLDEAGVPILFQRSLYAPDRYEYHMLLSRDISAGRPQWRHVG